MLPLPERKQKRSETPNSNNPTHCGERNHVTDNWFFDWYLQNTLIRKVSKQGEGYNFNIIIEQTQQPFSVVYNVEDLEKY